MKKHIHALIGATLLVCVTAGLAAADPPCQQDPPMPRLLERLDALTEKLDLTAAQTKALEELKTSSATERRTTRKEIQRLRHQLAGEMLADRPDAAKAAALVEQIGDLRTRRQIASLNVRLQVREILTDEQMDKLDALRPGGGRPGCAAGPGGCGEHRGRGHRQGHGERHRDDAPGWR